VSLTSEDDEAGSLGVGRRCAPRGRTRARDEWLLPLQEDQEMRRSSKIASCILLSLGAALAGAGCVAGSPGDVDTSRAEVTATAREACDDGSYGGGYYGLDGYCLGVTPYDPRWPYCQAAYYGGYGGSGDYNDYGYGYGGYGGYYGGYGHPGYGGYGGYGDHDGDGHGGYGGYGDHDHDHDGHGGYGGPYGGGGDGHHDGDGHPGGYGGYGGPYGGGDGHHDGDGHPGGGYGGYGGPYGGGGAGAPHFTGVGAPGGYTGSGLTAHDDDD
jgi:hypothetical protein